ncbi:hypothetical protein KZZ08_00530 [Roseovarius mucosus]|uniref:hypothetical protein n=1 Tax=Roseovarius mucosus TaxID=215743 RepID=UPI001C5D4217|nr:hypothetical protein [Roseovarius mucosus]MBW4972081.1 hypothetical protein [Roseovarius mucosus]
MLSPIAASTIVNQAFRFIELSPVSSFSDESEEATVALEQYPEALKMALESYDWSFARTLRILPPLVLEAPDVADPDLPHAYKLPADCVALRHIYEGDTFAWRVDAGMIRADRADALTIRYTRATERETDLPSLFRTLVSYQLAVLMSPRFVGSRTKQADLVSNLKDAFTAATRADNHTASQARTDGRSDQGDWSHEARR